MITSAYIHIPFCKRKCKYCTFSSYPQIQFKETYLNALIEEISARYKKEKLKTIYIGGGTPSLLSAENINNILSVLNFDENTEITCEANPESTSEKWLKEIKDIGVNRLSIGVQSFNDKILKSIGRKHSVKEAFEAVLNAKKAGFSNISVDLIYGLPNQEISDVSTSTITACELGIQHISTYGLKIEQGSFFYKNPPKNLPTEENQADMYMKIVELTKKYGFNHYEISNFSQKGFESKHNLNYWKAKEYYGFGCAASGYEKGIRYSHEKTIVKYCKNPTKITEKEKLSEQTKLEETIFLGLRKSEGININQINKKYNIDFEKKYLKTLKKYSEYLIKTKKGYCFNNQGFLISNYILSEFID